MVFLTHYQLPIRYEIGTNLSNSLHQNNSTHIFDHIHECRWRCRTIKTQILDKIIMEWFTKSILLPISRDVAMVEVTTEEQAILCSQHLDLIYFQSGTLYDIIPNAPHLSTQPMTPCRWCGWFCFTCIC
jgi:hypothetical protein